MRKVEQEALAAFKGGYNFKKANTEVVHTEAYRGAPTVSNLYLHGHKIFSLNRETNVYTVSDCGWKTATTASRLRAFCSDLLGYYWSLRRGDYGLTDYVKRGDERIKELTDRSNPYSRYAHLYEVKCC